MPLEGHVISTRADEALVGMTTDDMTAVINRAPNSDQLGDGFLRLRGRLRDPRRRHSARGRRRPVDYERSHQPN
jgi:hypothetical protein